MQIIVPLRNLVPSSTSDKAHCLASFFQSVHKRADVPVYDTYCKNTLRLYELRIEVDDAFGIISNSVINDRSDDDGLFSVSFKSYHFITSKIPWIIFNLSPSFVCSPTTT